MAELAPLWEGYGKWVDDILVEEHPTLLECLWDKGIVAVERTVRGFRFVEMCDSYHGATLTKDQMVRLIAELQALVDA